MPAPVVSKGGRDEGASGSRRQAGEGGGRRAAVPIVTGPECLINRPVRSGPAHWNKGRRRWSALFRQWLIDDRLYVKPNLAMKNSEQTRAPFVSPPRLIRERAFYKFPLRVESTSDQTRLFPLARVYFFAQNSFCIIKLPAARENSGARCLGVNFIGRRVVGVRVRSDGRVNLRAPRD